MSLSYALLVTGPAYGQQQAASAYQFAQQLLRQGHHLTCVFFYADGVANANAFTAPASDEFDLVQAWGRLSQQHQVDLFVCSAAALRRGVNSTAAVSNVDGHFTVTGLGELAQAALSCDRFIQF